MKDPKITGLLKLRNAAMGNGVRAESNARRWAMLRKRWQNGSILGSAFFLLASCLAASPALHAKEADDALIVKHEAVAFPDAEPGKSRVFFLRPKQGTMFMDYYLRKVIVMVNETPVGLLPSRTYAATFIEPGTRMVWGYRIRSPIRIEFESDKTYVIRLSIRRRQNSTDFEWVLEEDPTLVEDFVRDDKLAYVTLTAGGLEELGALAKISSRHAKLQRETNEAPKTLKELLEVTLPQTFQKVWYRGEKRPGLIKAYAATGDLTITEGSIDYSGKKVSFSFKPVEIVKISWGRMKGDRINKWSIVDYEQDGETKSIGFRTGKKLGWGEDTKPIYDSIKAAMNRADGGHQEDASVPEGT